MPCALATCAGRARLAEPFTHSPGEETLETAFFDPGTDLPFDQVSLAIVVSALWLLNQRAHQPNVDPVKNH